MQSSRLERKSSDWVGIGYVEVLDVMVVWTVETIGNSGELSTNHFIVVGGRDGSLLMSIKLGRRLCCFGCCPTYSTWSRNQISCRLYRTFSFRDQEFCHKRLHTGLLAPSSRLMPMLPYSKAFLASS